jgi:histidyl-tRNA synthetase
MTNPSGSSCVGISSPLQAHLVLEKSILGEDELQSGILTVKNFAAGVQSKVPRAELATVLSQASSK